MSQQINLYNPILATKKNYFSALAMLQAWAILAIFGGALCGYWVWSIHAASDAFKQTLSAQARELVNLQAAVKKSKTGLSPAELEAALSHDLQGLRADLQLREKLQVKLQQGLFRQGQGHAARLLLVAQSIPAQAWLSELKSDEAQLEISGFTLEPLVLKDWIGKLGASALLAGLKITSLKVEKVTDAKPQNGPASVWSFQLVGALANPADAVGVKP